MLHAQLFFYHPALLCLSNYYNKHSTLIDSFGRGWVLHTFIYTYISFRNLFYHPSCLSQSTLLEKTPFNHSFLSKGIEFSVFCSSFFYHPSLPYQSMLLGGGACCIPSFSFIILHCSVIPYNQEKYTTHSFDRGPNFIDICIYIYIFQEPRLSSFMSLPFHTFRKTPFNHSFLSKGIEFSAFFKNLFYHPSLLSQSMLLGGRGCCMPSFSFIILHCPVIPYY